MSSNEASSSTQYQPNQSRRRPMDSMTFNINTHACQPSPDHGPSLMSLRHGRGTTNLEMLFARSSFSERPRSCCHSCRCQPPRDISAAFLFEQTCTRCGSTTSVRLSSAPPSYKTCDWSSQAMLAETLHHGDCCHSAPSPVYSCAHEEGACQHQNSREGSRKSSERTLCGSASPPSSLRTALKMAFVK